MRNNGANITVRSSCQRILHNITMPPRTVSGHARPKEDFVLYPQLFGSRKSYIFVRLTKKRKNMCMLGTASPNMDRAEYEESLKVFWDFSNVLSTAERKGERNEKLRNAKNLKALGVDVETISKATGLTKDEIESL